MFKSLLEINAPPVQPSSWSSRTTLRMVERPIVLKTGRLIFDGSSAELLAHEDLWSWF
jgi:ABC-type lipopolysaccharide export system ATPase subunit